MRYWTGKNAILCSGRAMCGPAAESAMGWSFFFVLAPSAVFSVLVLPNLVRYCTAVVAVGEALAFVAAIVTLVRAGFTEPGVLPRARPLPVGAEAPPMEVDVATTAGKSCGRMRMCRTCLVYRSSRCSHCSFCDACVLDFDHHCPWIGNCVGRRNYRMFVSFLIAANLKCLYILALSITNLALVTVHDSANIAEAIARTPASLALIVFCVFILCTVGGLCSYHVSVMMEDTTTRMNLKHISRDAGDPVPEPGCGNLWRRLCTPPPPSFLPSHPQNWVESTPEAAAVVFDAAYGPCDIDSIRGRIDTDGSNVVLTISQMRVLFMASQPSSAPLKSTPTSGAQPSAPAIPLTAPPQPACEEVDAMTRFNGSWYQAVIVQRLAGGSSARVHFSGWGTEFSEVMSSEDLAKRTRPRVQGAFPSPVGPHVIESTSEIFQLYWPGAPLPGNTLEASLQQQQQVTESSKKHQPQSYEPQLQKDDGGGGIEMAPLQVAHSDGVSVSVNVNAIPRDE